MRRNFFRSSLVVLVPLLISIGFVAWAFVKESQGQVGFRRGIDLAGGTILVYEVDKERSESKNQGSALTSEDIAQLAEKLKRRIDPNDLKNVVVRPVGDSRVEIILPFAGSAGSNREAANTEFVEEVRNLVKQAGMLEFRIVANQVDDKAAIEEAQRIIADPANKELLLERARQGKPPLAPDQLYPVKAQGDEVDVKYEWVELAPEQRDSLRLSNKYGDPEAKAGDSFLWNQLKATRGNTYLNVFPAKKNNATASYLLYSRDFIKQQQTRDEEGKQVEYYMLTRVSPVDSFRVTNEIRLVNVRSTTDDEQRPAVGFSFNPAGSAKLGAMTERNRPTDAMLRSMAIVMDDKIVTAPTLNVVLRDGGIISGSFKQNEVNRLVNILRSGNLNADLKPDPVSENTIGATLGESTIRKGLISVAGAFIAVLIFMVIYYKFSGLIASTALLVNLVMTVGFMIAVSAAFTLPGLAGLVLMLGMAVDANVLIFERVREEREKGGTLAASIRLGYDRAFGTIIDTHLTSIFTCLVLYTFGNDNLKGFAVSLTLGLLISLLTSLYMTRLIFEFWLHKRWMTEYKPLKMLSKPSINFMAIRRQMFLLTAVLTMTGLVLFLSRGERVLNVDFTKGTAYGGRLREGEERPLSSSGDKKGMLELLGTDRQNERLKVKEVIWRSESAEVEQGEGSTRTVSENIYELIYEDGSRAIVTLANVPEGATKEEQLANLKQRASGLPDVSVEQVFLQGDDFSGGAARSFTIRTTEREPELVQVVLDRLLRDDANRPLLQTSRITSRVLKGSTLTVTFDTPTSPGYFKRFVERQVRLALADRSQFFKSADIEVRGVPTEVPEAGKASPDDIAAKQKQASEEGRTSRYQTIEVKFGGIIEFKALDNPATKPETKAELERVLNGALDEAQKAFEERPIPDRLETFDPALAKDTQNKAFQAILLSWLAILVYLWFRFGSWTFGLAAVLCLIHDLAFTLGAIALCHYAHDTLIGQFLQLQDFKIDLAAVAALLTLVGFSVNDTIVVFDRIREVRGKNPALTEQMINDSMNQTLSRTILSTTTVFLVVLVLYFFGGEGVHLFAFVMVTGVIVGTFSSIYVAAPLLLLLGEGKHRPTNTTEAIPVPAMPSATTS